MAAGPPKRQTRRIEAIDPRDLLPDPAPQGGDAPPEPEFGLDTWKALQSMVHHSVAVGIQDLFTESPDAAHVKKTLLTGIVPTFQLVRNIAWSAACHLGLNTKLSLPEKGPSDDWKLSSALGRLHAVLGDSARDITTDWPTPPAHCERHLFLCRVYHLRAYLGLVASLIPARELESGRLAGFVNEHWSRLPTQREHIAGEVLKVARVLKVGTFEVKPASVFPTAFPETLHFIANATRHQFETKDWEKGFFFSLPFEQTFVETCWLSFRAAFVEWLYANRLNQWTTATARASADTGTVRMEVDRGQKILADADATSCACVKGREYVVQAIGDSYRVRWPYISY